MNGLKFRTKWCLSTIAILFVALMLTFATTADALQLTIDVIDSSTHSKVIADGDANDSNPLAGVISYYSAISGNIGIFNVELTIGAQTKPTAGTASNPIFVLHDVSSSSASGEAGILNISASDQNYNIDGTGLSGWTFDASGSPANTMSLQAYYDNTNALHGHGTLIGDTGLFASADAFHINSGDTPSGDFSLTLAATINHAGGMFEHSSFNADLNPLPEPGTILLLGFGLLGLGIIRRKKIMG